MRELCGLLLSNADTSASCHASRGADSVISARALSFKATLVPSPLLNLSLFPQSNNYGGIVRTYADLPNRLILKLSEGASEIRYTRRQTFVIIILKNIAMLFSMLAISARKILLLFAMM